MYPVILLGSLPGALMAIGKFARENAGWQVWALFGAAFITGQGTAWWLCRRFDR